VAADHSRQLRLRATALEVAAGTLSGGNQQKVVLARWLALRPKVLLLDEPTRGVDIGAKAEIYRLIREIAARGVAVLMISSELPEVLGMSDRILVLREGRVGGVLAGRGTDERTVMALATGIEEQVA
jgi:ABC-type sugar transport system ATPase subunit